MLQFSTSRHLRSTGLPGNFGTIFQGLAADGAKLALWRLWRSGFRLVNFIHDQVLIEVPEDADLPTVAATVQDLMVGAMEEVAPSVQINVEWAYRKRWSKRTEDQYPITTAAAVQNTTAAIFDYPSSFGELIHVPL